MRYPTPDQWRQMSDMAKVIAESGIGPEDIRGNPAKVMAVTLKGFELGLGFMQSMDGIHVVKGRPELSADLKSALAQQRIPGCIVEWLEDGMNGVATVRVTRAGRRDVVMSITDQQVEQMGLDEQRQGEVKQTWQKHRPAMMRAYVLRSALRMQCPEVEYGFDAPEVVLAEQQARSSAPVEAIAEEPRVVRGVMTNPVYPPKPSPLADSVGPSVRDAELVDDLAGEEQRSTLPADLVLPLRSGEFANRTLSSLTRNEITRLIGIYRDRIEKEPTSDKMAQRQEWLGRLTAWDQYRAGGAA